MREEPLPDSSLPNSPDKSPHPHFQWECCPLQSHGVKACLAVLYVSAATPTLVHAWNMKPFRIYSCFIWQGALKKKKKKSPAGAVQLLYLYSLLNWFDRAIIGHGWDQMPLSPTRWKNGRDCIAHFPGASQATSMFCPEGTMCVPSPTLAHADQYQGKSFLTAVVQWAFMKRARVSGEPLGMGFTSEHSRSWVGSDFTRGVAGSWKDFSKATVSFGNICQVTWPAEKARFPFCKL